MEGHELSMKLGEILSLNYSWLVKKNGRDWVICGFGASVIVGIQHEHEPKFIKFKPP